MPHPPSASPGTAVRERVAQKRPDTIAGMFDEISPRYDVLNHVLSGGTDFYWRWRTARALGLTGREVVLDLCTGTSDLAIELLRRGRARRVVGLDFAGEMLRIGQRKLAHLELAARAPLMRGDAMFLPLADATVDAVTIAFGIRNVQRPDVALREIARVLKPGGRVAVVEFSLPRLPGVRQVYSFYFRHILPRVGALLSNHADAYTYLPESVGEFHPPERFVALLGEEGFVSVRATSLTFGVAQLYLGVKDGTRPAETSSTAS
ncbi:MAG: bifunctional demethylmenaquinone methyltransferase/2-methoxy-6-polyprenyl-1,4-benzoquinol methylase UbiE [Vicinamibacterales bacterium]